MDFSISIYIQFNKIVVYYLRYQIIGLKIFVKILNFTEPFKPGKAKYIAKILLYVTDGVAFPMIDRPNTINDKVIWDELRNIMIGIQNR